MTSPAGLLTGKTALITGAAQGLGHAILDGFAAAGATGLALDLRPPPAPLPPGWFFEAGDVAREADLTRAFGRVEASEGRLDILVANAGIVPAWRESAAIDLAEWDRVFAVNVRGVAAAIKLAVPLMRETGGAILCMASVNGLTAHPRQMAYTASKHAVIGIMRAAARDLGRHRIRVNALAPGPVATEALLGRLDERAAAGGLAAAEALSRYAETPLGRLATAADVAGAAVFLASALAAGITGQVLSVDAGLTP
jgi:NAD(P)-dependent dehydrogenase (short-subunit alcohol dehydrogenase family)